MIGVLKMGIYIPDNENQPRDEAKGKLSFSEKVAEAYSKYFPDSMIFFSCYYCYIYDFSSFINR